MSDTPTIPVKRGPGRPPKAPAPSIADSTPAAPVVEPTIPDKAPPKPLRKTNPAEAPDPKSLDKSIWDIGHKAIRKPVEEVEAEETPVSTPEKTAKIEVNVDAIPDDLLEEAVSQGIKLSSARDMGGKALRTALDIIKSRTASAPQEPATADSPAKQLNPFFDSIPEYATSLDDKVVDEGIAKDIKGLAGHTNTYLKSIQGGMAALRNDVSSELLSMKVEQFDSMVTDLGREWESTFGKGDNSDLNPNSNEFAARAKLFDAMQRVRDESRRKGEVISSKKAFKKALGLEFSDAVEKATAEKKEDAKRNAQGHFISRPTNRETVSADSAKDKAEAYAQKFLKERGIGVRTNTPIKKL